MHARPFPSTVHRRPPADAAAVRAHWRALAEDAIRMGEAADGSESYLMPLNFRGRVKVAAALPAAERGDALAAQVEKVFRGAVDAMLLAGTPERRAIAGPLLAAAARAVEAMLFEAIRPQVEHGRRMMGERD